MERWSDILDNLGSEAMEKSPRRPPLPSRPMPGVPVFPQKVPPKNGVSATGTRSNRAATSGVHLTAQSTRTAVSAPLDTPARSRANSESVSILDDVPDVHRLMDFPPLHSKDMGPPIGRRPPPPPGRRAPLPGQAPPRGAPTPPGPRPPGPGPRPPGPGPRPPPPVRGRNPPPTPAGRGRVPPPRPPPGGPPPLPKEMSSSMIKKAAGSHRSQPSEVHPVASHNSPLSAPSPLSEVQEGPAPFKRGDSSSSVTSSTSSKSIPPPVPKSSSRVSIVSDSDGAHPTTRKRKGTLNLPAEVLFDFEATEDRCVSTSKGEIVKVLRMDESGWWAISCSNGKGYVPSKFVRLLDGKQNKPPPPIPPLSSKEDNKKKEEETNSDLPAEDITQEGEEEEEDSAYQEEAEGEVATKEKGEEVPGIPVPTPSSASKPQAREPLASPRKPIGGISVMPLGAISLRKTKRASADSNASGTSLSFTSSLDDTNSVLRKGSDEKDDDEDVFGKKEENEKQRDSDIEEEQIQIEEMGEDEPLPDRPRVGTILQSVYARGLYEYSSDDPVDLMFGEGDIIRCLTPDEDGWMTGELQGKRGTFPSNYVEILSPANRFAVVLYDFTSESGDLSVEDGDFVEILDDSDDTWVSVQYRDQTGYIPLNYIQK